MAVHKNLGDSELHEMKGAAGASVDQVPVANGSGGTTFKKLTKDSLDTSSIKDTNRIYLTLTVASPLSTFTYYVPVPFDCTISSVSGTVASAPNTGMTVSIYNTAETSPSCSLSFTTSGTIPQYTTTTSISYGTISAGGYIKVTNSAGVTACGSLTLVFLLTMV